MLSFFVVNIDGFCGNFFFVCLFAGPGIEPRTSYILTKHSTTELSILSDQRFFLIFERNLTRGIMNAKIAIEYDGDEIKIKIGDK